MCLYAQAEQDFTSSTLLFILKSVSPEISCLPIFIFTLSLSSYSTPDALRIALNMASTASPSIIRILNVESKGCLSAPFASICNWHKGLPKLEGRNLNFLSSGLNCRFKHFLKYSPASSTISSDIVALSLLAFSR